MLTIKRVPTVLSNYQEDSGEPRGCDRNCVGKCCLPVSKLPLYAFESDARPKISSSGDDEPPSDFFLNTLLLGQWEDRMSRGLFRYDVMACETKVIPGEYGFVAQLNEGRHLKKRPTEFRVDRVLQPFDRAKFNFTKVGQEEVLFRFEPGESGSGRLLEDGAVGDADAPNVVAINVSPIEYGHVLLIPRVLDCLPRRIDPDSFLLALHMAAEAGSPYFRLGYNSLGAFATIDHLHFQCYAEKQALGEVGQDLLDTQVNPAVWEISGHMVLKRKKDYDEASEHYAWRLLAEVSLSEARFEEVKVYIFEATGLVESEKEKMEPGDNRGAPYQSPSPVGTASPHLKVA